MFSPRINYITLSSLLRIQNVLLELFLLNQRNEQWYLEGKGNRSGPAHGTVDHWWPAVRAKCLVELKSDAESRCAINGLMLVNVN